MTDRLEQLVQMTRTLGERYRFVYPFDWTIMRRSLGGDFHQARHVCGRVGQPQLTDVWLKCGMRCSEEGSGI